MDRLLKELLQTLESNGGSCLYWQLPAGWSWALLEALQERGEVVLDPAWDLVIHPKARKVEDGLYTME